MHEPNAISPATNPAAPALPDPAVSETIRRIAGVLSEVEDYKLETQDDLDGAAAILSKIKGEWNRGDAERKELNRPDEARISQRNDLYRKPLADLKAAEAKIKGAVDAYLREQERRRIELQRQRDEARRRQIEEATALMQDRDDPVAQETADELLAVAAQAAPVQTYVKPSTVITKEVRVPVYVDPETYGIAPLQSAARDALAYLGALPQEGHAKAVTANLAAALTKAVPFEYLRVEPATAALKGLAARTKGLARVGGVMWEVTTEIGSRSR